MLDSVRALQKASELDKVSEQRGVKRFSLGSFSESVRVFDPDKLKAVVGQLAGELNPVNADPRLKEQAQGTGSRNRLKEQAQGTPHAHPDDRGRHGARA